MRHRRDVCVTANVGDLSLVDMGNRSGVVISTKGGSMGHVEIISTIGLTIRSARFRSVEIRNANRTKIERSRIGGTRKHRTLDQLIFMPEHSNHVLIRNNNIGWTRADDSGNTGYGCRCYGTLNGLRFVRNKVHDIAADGFQGVAGSNVVIDRNEIGPVGPNPGSSEHSDNIQIVNNGRGLRITNNWLHGNGYYNGRPVAGSGNIYIHGGSTGSLLIQNNLFTHSQGRTEIGGLGTGGRSRSNITIRRNTWDGLGRSYAGFPGFEWDIVSGSGNTVADNVAVDPDGGFAMDGSRHAAHFSHNIWGHPSRVRLDSRGNCISRNCNPGRHTRVGYRKRSRVGYRKPSRVRW